MRQVKRGFLCPRSRGSLSLYIHTFLFIHVSRMLCTTLIPQKCLALHSCFPNALPYIHAAKNALHQIHGSQTASVLFYPYTTLDLTIDCVSVREINYLLKLVVYLLVQADKPWYNYYLHAIDKIRCILLSNMTPNPFDQ